MANANGPLVLPTNDRPTSADDSEDEFDGHLSPAAGRQTPVSSKAPKRKSTIGEEDLLGEQKKMAKIEMENSKMEEENNEKMDKNMNGGNHAVKKDNNDGQNCQNGERLILELIFRQFNSFLLTFSHVIFIFIIPGTKS
jgi:hypothetical protein